jgi:hypothetical protein
MHSAVGISAVHGGEDVNPLGSRATSDYNVPAFAYTSHAHPARAVGGPKHPRLPPAAQCHGLVAKRDVVLYFRDAWSQPCSPLGLVPLRPRPDAASQNNLATTGFDRDAIRVYLCDPP